MYLDRRCRIILWVGVWILLAGTLATAVAYAVKVERAKHGMALNLGDPTPAPPEAISVYTGLPITKAQSAQRAIGVMIAGDPITRPQSGLGAADVVVEMEAAPGITRYLAIFQSLFASEIGSIRSARNDYIDLARGFDSVLVHWGGEKRALDRLAVDDTAEIDQFANGDLFFRKLDVPAPHNGFTSDEGMREGLKRFDYDRKPHFDAWDFVGDAPRTDRLAGGTLSLTYGSYDFDIVYTYDPVTNTYRRQQGGVAHKDALTGEVIAPKNVVVVRANYSVLQGRSGYLQFDFSTGGECSLFQNGSEIDCTWTKGDEDEPLQFFGTDKQPLALVAGQTWVQVMLPTAAVEWKPTLPEPNGIPNTR